MNVVTQKQEITELLTLKHLTLSLIEVGFYEVNYGKDKNIS